MKQWLIRYIIRLYVRLLEDRDFEPTILTNHEKRNNVHLHLIFSNIYIYILVTGSKGQTPIQDTYGSLEEEISLLS